MHDPDRRKAYVTTGLDASEMPASGLAEANNFYTIGTSRAAV
jgi:hypothetical protein